MTAGASLVGTILDGKYSVDRLIGRGGMGEVYAGTHSALGRAVAIKVLHSSTSRNRSFVARFEREARTTAMFEHPNAVHVHDFGTLADGSRYLVMEFIEGVTLRDILRANTALEPGIAADLIVQAGGAVAEAHVHGIVHRDLKPENMMVRRDDDGRLFLKVVDFGLAKLVANPATLLTNASEIIGTPRYMAPEQFQGLPVDGRADVYALGCVLFELLTGRAPYEGAMLEIVGQHVHAAIPRLEREGARFSSALESAVQRALAKAAADRQQSAGEFVRELATAAAGLSKSPLRVAIPATGDELFCESTGNSGDLTAMPGALPGDAGVADSETKAVDFASGAVGSPVPTITVPVPAGRRIRWQLPASVAIVGVIVVAGLSFLGRGAVDAPSPQSGSVPGSVGSVAASESPVSSEVVPPDEPPDANVKATEPSSGPAGHATPAHAPAQEPDPADSKKDNRGVLPVVGEKTKDAVVGTGRKAKSLAGKIRRGIPGLKPKPKNR
ncbi:MAG: protein kinase [Acidobacteria bacterium]|nr:protein kinase [Acidobacteriota bacterium]